MTKFITEREKNLPVRAGYDMIVAGGGLGGVSAAIASAKTGARTLLIERNAFVGGVATAGMCCSVFNCFYTSEHQLGTTGNALEIVDALADSEGYGKKWRKHKGHIIYDLERGKYILQSLLEKYGVDILLNTLVSDVITADSKIKGLVVESKSGREVITCAFVVDSTGDADVAAKAEVPLKINREGMHSFCFRMGGVDVDAFVDYFRKEPDEYPAYMDIDWNVDEAVAFYDDCGVFLFPHGGGMQMRAFQKAKQDGTLPETVGVHDTTDACQMHLIRRTGMAHIITGFSHFDGLDIDKITRSVNDGREMVFSLSDVYRRYIPGFQNAFVAGTAANLGVRVSRYLDGDFIFTKDMTSAGQRFEDCVGRMVGGKDIIKNKGEGAWGVQVCNEDSFDIPLRCLAPKNISNLLMGAGRSVSSEHPSLLRVMVHTMVIGQEAGVAAAVSAKTGDFPAGKNISKIQEELEKQGVKLK